MNIILGGRRSGKTVLIVRLSSETQIPILVGSHGCAKRIKLVAEKMNLKIPEPIVYNEHMEDKFAGSNSKEVYIDDADWVLQCILGTVKINAITMNNDGFNVLDIGGPKCD